MIEKAVKSRAEAHAGLSALVSTRIYPDQLPQGPVYPAVTYQVISDVPAARGGGADSGLQRARIQVTAWSEDKLEAITVVEQIKECFDRWSGTAASVVVQVVFKFNRYPIPVPSAPDSAASGRGVTGQAYDFEFVYEG